MLQILKIPEGDILRKIRETVNQNADLMIVGISLSKEGILILTTLNEETLEVDLSAVYMTIAQYIALTEGENGGGPASEETAGPVMFISEAEVKDWLKNPDDTKAITLAKILQLFEERGMPQFDLGTPKKNDVLIHDGERFVPSTAQALVEIGLTDPSSNISKLVCAIVAKCTGGGSGGGGGGTNPTTPVSKFTRVHYETVAKIVVPAYDYILANGVYAGTFEVLNLDGYGLWSLKRGVGYQPVDILFRRADTSDPWQNAGLNLAANRDRSDVIAADGINTPNGLTCGRADTLPAAFATGYEIEVAVQITGTTVQLKGSPKRITVPLAVAPVPNAYRINGDNAADEGGLAKQQTLQQKQTDNSWVDVPAENWAVAGNPAGVSVISGAFKGDANSISTTAFFEIGCNPVGNAQYVSKRIQLVDTGCTRPAGLTTFTGTYALAPKPGNATLFSSLSDANNRMGDYFNAPANYSPAQFPFQAANLNKGTDVYNRADITTCERVNNDIIYVSDSSNGNTVKKAIEVRDGKIYDVQDSAYVAPKPEPDTSWASLVDPMTTKVPAYYQANGSVYTWSNGLACANPGGLIYPTGALVLDKKADRILALITPNASAGQPLLGVGLAFNINPTQSDGGIKGGYNLLLTTVGGVSQVRFLHDYNTFGPAYNYDWQIGQSYYMAMRYSRADKLLTGKVWKSTESEPATWPYSWANVADVDGYAALIAASDYMGGKSSACIDKYWIKEVGANPALSDVARNKKVVAPDFDPGLGASWSPNNITDGNDNTLYTTYCIEIDQVSDVVVDLNALARPQQVAIVPRQDLPNAMPIDYTIGGSIDGVNWTTLLTVTNQARGPQKTTLSIPQQNGVFVQCRYVRLRSTKNGRAESGDCIRIQLATFEVYAETPEAIPAAQVMSIQEIAYAFVGTYGPAGNTARDTMYFVKNDVVPVGNQTGVGPTWGFYNTTANGRNGLNDNNEMLFIDNIQNMPAGWTTIVNQAKARGFKWLAYGNIGGPGESITFRFKGNKDETAYRDFVSVGPPDNTNVNLTNVFPSK